MDKRSYLSTKNEESHLGGGETRIKKQHEIILNDFVYSKTPLI